MAAHLIPLLKLSFLLKHQKTCAYCVNYFYFIVVEFLVFDIVFTLIPRQVVIRQLLLTSLDDSNGKIRTAIGMAVAAIGQNEWPEDCLELHPFLLKLIGDQSNGNGGT